MFLSKFKSFIRRIFGTKLVVKNSPDFSQLGLMAKQERVEQQEVFPDFQNTGEFKPSYFRKGNDRINVGLRDPANISER